MYHLKRWSNIGFSHRAYPEKYFAQWLPCGGVQRISVSGGFCAAPWPQPGYQWVPHCFCVHNYAVCLLAFVCQCGCQWMLRYDCTHLSVCLSLFLNLAISECCTVIVFVFQSVSMCLNLAISECCSVIVFVFQSVSMCLNLAISECCSVILFVFQSVSMCLNLAISECCSVNVFVFQSVSLSLYHMLAINECCSVIVFSSLSLSLFLTTRWLSVSAALWLRLSFSLSLSLSLYGKLAVSECCTVIVFVLQSVTVSISDHTLAVSECCTVIVFVFQSVTVSVCFCTGAALHLCLSFNLSLCFCTIDSHEDFNNVQNCPDEPYIHLLSKFLFKGNNLIGDCRKKRKWLSFWHLWTSHFWTLFDDRHL